MLSRKPSGRNTWLRMGLSFFLLLIGAAAIMAQDITSGTIQGSVTDEQGGAVAGASVEARNIDTNYTRTFVTNSDGRFVLLTMPPGRYVVSVTKDGFAKLNQENIELT